MVQLLVQVQMVLPLYSIQLHPQVAVVVVDINLLKMD
jgi:hypothetical protein